MPRRLPRARRRAPPAPRAARIVAFHVIESRNRSCILVPRAAVLQHPMQHLKVLGPSGFRTALPVPRAIVLPRPLQHIQVPAPSGALTRSFAPRFNGVPRAPVLPRPLQHVQVPTRGDYRTPGAYACALFSST